MSLQRNTMPDSTAVQFSEGRLSLALRHMLAPLVHQVVESRKARTTAESRKAIKREISQLPRILHQDLAFSDGTVIALDRS